MIVTGGLRILQLLFSVIVLGLSVTLINGQLTGTSPPSQTTYAAFCGGLGVLVALIGLAALFLEPLKGIIMVALDGLASILLLAGGITFAATLGINSCSDTYYVEANTIVRGGPYVDGVGPIYNGQANLTARCQKAQATTAFLFFGMAALLGTTTLGLLGRSGQKGSIV